MSKNRTLFIGLGVIALIALVTTLASPLMPYNDEGQWGFPFGEREEEDIIPDIPDVYNEQKAWTDVQIKIGLKNGYTYNHPAIPGLAVEVRDGSNTYVDGGTTGSDGTWTSTVESFDSGDSYTLIAGGIATTNKSQEFSFVVQGQDGDSKPSYIHCGTFHYLPVAEESAIAFAFYDKDYAALSAVNFTADYTDFIVEGYVRATFTSSSYGFGREMFSSTKGGVEAYICYIFTEVNTTTSNAIRAEGTQDLKGYGGGTGVRHIVAQLKPVSYQVDEDSQVIDPHKSIHWFKFKFDFSGCGIPATYTAATAQRLTLSAVVSFEYDWTIFAAGGSAWLSTWFSDTDLSAINLST